MHWPTLARAAIFPCQLRVNWTRGQGAGPDARSWRSYRTSRRTHVSAESAASTGAAGASTASWTDPGLFTVAPGVHRVPLPLPTDGLRAVNVYVLEDGDGLVLIDS